MNSIEDDRREASWRDSSLPDLSELWQTIDRRLGTVPSFYLMARSEPALAWNLYRMAEFAYYENPLPSLFKEQLSAYLSRFCEVRYCIARHCGFLLGAGFPSGDRGARRLGPEDILALLKEPLPAKEELPEYLSRLEALDPVGDDWPDFTSEAGTLIHIACAVLFLQPVPTQDWVVALRKVVGARRYEQLVLMLAFNRMAHFWTHAHPEIALDPDVQQLLKEHEMLVEPMLSTVEAERWELGEQLHDELMSLRDRLALEGLQKAYEAKDEFVSLVAHELRGPVTTIFGNAQFLSSRLDRLPREVVQQSIDDIRNESARLERIIRDLLVVARPELGAPEFEPVRLVPSIERVVREHHARVPGREFRLNAPDPTVAVIGHEEYLEQVLRNLVSNAEKYSPGDRPIDVTVEGAGPMVKIGVIDQGRGISPEDRPRIFDAFFRASTTSGSAPGIGVGLAVCKRLVETMGGELWADSEPGEGSAFWFTLPLAAVDAVDVV